MKFHNQIRNYFFKLSGMVVLLFKTNDDIINRLLKPDREKNNIYFFFILLFKTFTIKLISELYKIIKLNSNIIITKICFVFVNYLVCSSCIYSFTVEVRPTYVSSRAQHSRNRNCKQHFDCCCCVLACLLLMLFRI